MSVTGNLNCRNENLELYMYFQFHEKPKEKSDYGVRKGEQECQNSI